MPAVRMDQRGGAEAGGCRAMSRWARCRPGGAWRYGLWRDRVAPSRPGAGGQHSGCVRPREQPRRAGRPALRPRHQRGVGKAISPAISAERSVTVAPSRAARAASRPVPTRARRGAGNRRAPPAPPVTVAAPAWRGATGRARPVRRRAANSLPPEASSTCPGQACPRPPARAWAAVTGRPCRGPARIGRPPVSASPVAAEIPMPRAPQVSPGTTIMRKARVICPFHAHFRRVFPAGSGRATDRWFGLLRFCAGRLRSEP